MYIFPICLNVLLSFYVIVLCIMHNLVYFGIDLVCFELSIHKSKLIIEVNYKYGKKHVFSSVRGNKIVIRIKVLFHHYQCYYYYYFEKKFYLLLFYFIHYFKNSFLLILKKGFIRYTKIISFYCILS